MESCAMSFNAKDRTLIRRFAPPSPGGKRKRAPQVMRLLGGFRLVAPGFVLAGRLRAATLLRRGLAAGIGTARTRLVAAIVTLAIHARHRIAFGIQLDELVGIAAC